MFKKRGSKKAQLTIFIIVGLVLLVLFGIYLYSQGYFFTLPENINAENVRGKVELCLAQNVERAMTLLSKKNGYVYDSDFAASISTGNYTMDKAIIGQQIDKYLKDSMKGCIDGFEDLKDYYYIEPGEDLSSELVYRNDKLVVKLDYPIKVSDNLNKDSVLITEFETSIPVRLKLILEIKEDLEKIHDQISDHLAKNIALPIKQDQQSDEEYKKILMDTIAVNSRKNLNNIRIANTESEKHEDDTELAISNRIYPGISIELSYNRLPLQFTDPDFELKDVYNKNLLRYTKYLKKDAFNLNFSMSIPVSVRIADKLSFSSKGYEFNYVMPLEIDFSSDEKYSEYKELTLDPYFVQSDYNLSSFTAPKKLANQQLVIEIYNADSYAAAIYPYDETISVPADGKKYTMNALLFEDYRLVGGYKTDFILDKTKSVIKINALEFPGMTESLILSKLGSTDYQDDVSFVME